MTFDAPPGLRQNKYYYQINNFSTAFIFSSLVYIFLLNNAFNRYFYKQLFSLYIVLFCILNRICANQNRCRKPLITLENSYN